MPANSNVARPDATPLAVYRQAAGNVRRPASSADMRAALAQQGHGDDEGSAECGQYERKSEFDRHEKAPVSQQNAAKRELVPNFRRLIR